MPRSVEKVDDDSNDFDFEEEESKGKSDYDEMSKEDLIKRLKDAEEDDEDDSEYRDAEEDEEEPGDVREQIADKILSIEDPIQQDWFKALLSVEIDKLGGDHLQEALEAANMMFEEHPNPPVPQV